MCDDTTFIEIVARRLQETTEAVELALSSVGRDFKAIKRFLWNDRGDGIGSCFDRKAIEPV